MFLDDDRAHRTPALLEAASNELGVRPVSGWPTIEFHTEPDPAQVRGDERALVSIRASLAARWAVAELAATQLVIPVMDPGGAEPTDDLLGRADAPGVTIRAPHGSFGVPVNLPRPMLASAYVRSAHARLAHRWYLDPDIFYEDLADLELDVRARHALREALEAYRRGLYVASTALLGVVSEAAWYRAAELLGKPGRLAPAVREERTPTVQKLVADNLRQNKVGSSTLPDELLANAGLLRALRNYGVHPVKTRDDLDRHFNDEECGLLILRTRNYLAGLAGAVREAIAKGPTSPET
jgi:hypothetical protein